MRATCGGARRRVARAWVALPLAKLVRDAPYSSERAGGMVIYLIIIVYLFIYIYFLQVYPAISGGALPMAF
jgi:hypothetical protein